jgi:glucose/arabinose dehydrogenase
MRQLLPLLILLLALAGCGGDDQPDAQATRTATPSAGSTEMKVEVMVTGLEVPWEIAFMPDGRALVTERPGRVRLLDRDGRLREQPAATMAVDGGEGGLMGLALDPRFESNNFVYLYRSQGGANQVVRYRFASDELTGETVLVDGIGYSPIHSGGRMKFGPDGRLYLSVGDAADPSVAQDPAALNGKIVRMEADALRGQPPLVPEVFSIGHRNPQGFDWEPGTDRLISDEHGQSGNDELNVIRKGANYGWPVIEGEATQDGMETPIALYQSPSAPSGGTFVRQDGSAWTGSYLIAMLAGERLQRVVIDGDEVVEQEKLLEGEYGRLREVVEGPDGALYVLTSNRDGRGSATDEDDRIIRIQPPSS